MNAMPIAVTITSSLLSGMIGVAVSASYYRRYDALILKRDVFRRFAGNRHLSTVVPCETSGEPFIALNKAFIVFNDSPAVVAALKKTHDELGQKERLVANLVTVMKKMAESTGISIKELNDSFLERPFAPGKQRTPHNTIPADVDIAGSHPR